VATVHISDGVFRTALTRLRRFLLTGTIAVRKSDHHNLCRQAVAPFFSPIVAAHFG